VPALVVGERVARVRDGDIDAAVDVVHGHQLPQAERMAPLLAGRGNHVGGGGHHADAGDDAARDLRAEIDAPPRRLSGHIGGTAHDAAFGGGRHWCGIGLRLRIPTREPHQPIQVRLLLPLDLGDAVALVEAGLALR
jgi:hypothetical protein